jgi:hypothetical protein
MYGALDGPSNSVHLRVRIVPAEGMDPTNQPRWQRTTILVGLAYTVIGLATIALSPTSSQAHVASRLAAWLISGVAFAAHIWYSRLRLNESPVATAFHAALSVALGAFALAVSAAVHSLPSSSRSMLAFLVWPIAIGIPAFVAALAAANVLSLLRRRA